MLKKCIIVFARFKNYCIKIVLLFIYSFCFFIDYENLIYYKFENKFIVKF